MAASSRFARTYRDLAVVRIEFTLPKAQWREVHLSRLNHRPGLATIGQKALGPLARVDWSTPHKAIFGATRSGKTICLADLIISLAQTHQPDDAAEMQSSAHLAHEPLDSRPALNRRSGLRSIHRRR